MCSDTSDSAPGSSQNSLLSPTAPGLPRRPLASPPLLSTASQNTNPTHSLVLVSTVLRQDGFLSFRKALM